MSNLTICGMLCMPSHCFCCALTLIQPLQSFRQRQIPHSFEWDRNSSPRLLITRFP
ncbi:unnamed protein product, partial [Brassica oleracea var. botrytis]